MPFGDRELLARLIQCEAGGEGEIGMKAVATVVMNRATINYGEFGRVNQKAGATPIQNIIMQTGQFTCAVTVKNGIPNPQNIFNMRPTAIHYEIADWAIGGNRLQGVDNSLYFYNPFSVTCAPFFPPPNYGVIHNRIGEHCFYIPTSFYENT
jgi:N-acetylmuramoyl-L-alanine amidase